MRNLATSASSEELLSDNARLRDEYTVFMMFSGMPEYVMLLNEHRQIVYANPVVEEYARAHHGNSSIGFRLGELFCCGNSYSASFGCGTGAACSACGALEATLLALDGSKSVHECHLLRLADSTQDAVNLRVWGTPYPLGDRLYVLLVAVDISNEKRLEVLEALFLHDVMNTAGVVQGMADILMSDCVEGEDEIKKCLITAAKQLVDEIQHQRIIRSAELNTLTLQYTPLATGEILQNICALYKEFASEKGKRLVVASAASGATTLVSDWNLLARILGNLVKNALEACAVGDSVQIGWSADEHTVTFNCHNPQHIPEADQYRLFTRSFSTKGKGRGLGTYGAKMLAERYLGGKVEFSSCRDGGTLFSVVLPRTPLETIGQE